MKISVSLPDEDVAVLDDFVRVAGLPSRSAALRRAIAMLRMTQLDRDYEVAWDEWAASGEHEAWDTTAADGLTDAPR
jgi:Arc/MetJ-type ribon-helix-helix transcriptional regulator